MACDTAGVQLSPIDAWLLAGADEMFPHDKYNWSMRSIRRWQVHEWYYYIDEHKLSSRRGSLRLVANCRRVGRQRPTLLFFTLLEGMWYTYIERLHITLHGVIDNYGHVVVSATMAYLKLLNMILR